VALYICFNPCFNGCSSATDIPTQEKIAAKSFNPCFNGCSSATIQGSCSIDFAGSVSILVLMDVPLQRSITTGLISEGQPFQSLF